MTEQEIIKLCQQKSPLGQKELVHQYSKVLMGLTYRYTLSRADSKDILQDTFIKVFEKFGQFDPAKGALGSWLKSIAINTTLMKLRKDKTILENREKYGSHQSRTQEIRILNTGLEEKDLYQMVLSLPNLQRLVFNLCAIEGYSHAEIATKLDITESYSRTTLTRARASLKILFEKRYSYKTRYDERS